MIDETTSKADCLQFIFYIKFLDKDEHGQPIEYVTLQAQVNIIIIYINVLII